MEYAFQSEGPGDIQYVPAKRDLKDMVPLEAGLIHADRKMKQAMDSANPWDYLAYKMLKEAVLEEMDD